MRMGCRMQVDVLARNLFDKDYLTALTVQTGNSALILGQPSDPRISVTAFVSPDDRRVVVVAINPTDESVPLDPNAIVADRNPASVYVTDATRDLAALEDVGDEFSLPAQSLSTFIFDR